MVWNTELARDRADLAEERADLIRNMIGILTSDLKWYWEQMKVVRQVGYSTTLLENVADALMCELYVWREREADLGDE